MFQQYTNTLHHEMADGIYLKHRTQVCYSFLSALTFRCDELPITQSVKLAKIQQLFKDTQIFKIGNELNINTLAANCLQSSDPYNSKL